MKHQLEPCIPVSPSEAATAWQRGVGIGDLGTGELDCSCNNQQWDANFPGDCWLGLPSQFWKGSSRKETNILVQKRAVVGCLGQRGAKN